MPRSSAAGAAATATRGRGRRSAPVGEGRTPSRSQRDGWSAFASPPRPPAWAATRGAGAVAGGGGHGLVGGRRPAHGLEGDGGMEAPTVELALARLGDLAQLEQRQGEPSSSFLELCRRGPGLGPGQPGVVLGLQALGEALGLRPVQGGEASAHLDVGVPVHPGGAEAAAAFDGLEDRCVATTAHPHTEAAGGVGEVEIEALGLVVETVGDAPQEPDGRGPEDGQPEPLGVGPPGIDAELVDDRIGPRLDVERGKGDRGFGGERHVASWAIRGSVHVNRRGCFSVHFDVREDFRCHEMCQEGMRSDRTTGEDVPARSAPSPSGRRER